MTQIPPGSPRKAAQAPRAPEQQRTPGATVASPASRAPFSASRAELLWLGALALVFAWTYWPTMLRLVHAWNVEPDYSHGYLVAPLALYFLWLAKDRRPQLQGPAWGGLALIAAALALHVTASLFYLDSLNGWSIPIWLAGAAWLMGGRKFCGWCLPAVAFLVFMVPLPYRVEGMLSRPLQRVSTELSCWALQCLGQPALAEGNVINIDAVQLEVAQACSGLRIFVSIVALAYAYAILVPRPWWTKLLLFASVPVIAVTTNAVRVTLVGVAYPYVATPDAHRLLHDVAGWLVIPLAAVLMGLFLWYIGKLFVPVRQASGRGLLVGR